MLQISIDCVWYAIQKGSETMIEYEAGKDNSLKIFIVGEIDHHSSETLRKEIDRIILSYSPKSVLLNFKKVSFCDSSGIAVVLGRYKLMNKIGGQLFLENLPKQVDSIFRLSGLNKLVTVKK